MRPVKRPSRAGLRLALLVLPTLLLSHELIYLLAHGSGAGYERAMLEGGHGRYWTTFVLIVGVLSAAITGVVAVQLHRLHAQARALRGSGVLPEGRARDLVRWTLASGWRVAFAVTAAFLFQETAERGASSGSPLAAVTGEHGIALPVILVVSMLVAFVAALVRWRRRLLLARLRAARTCAPRIRQQRRPAAVTNALVGATMMCRNGLRAPPRQVAVAA